MTRMYTTHHAALLVAALLLSSAAEARPRATACAPTGDVMRPCAPGTGGVPSVAAERSPQGPRGASRVAPPRSASVAPRRAASIVSHPAGCPRRLFCGCGGSVRVFGRPVRELFLALNWLKFPRANPAPGMAAVRRGHMFVLEEHRRGKIWLVYDANSGGNQTRIHERSIEGYTIVNPRA